MHGRTWRRKPNPPQGKRIKNDGFDASSLQIIR